MNWVLAEWPVGRAVYSFVLSKEMGGGTGPCKTLDTLPDVESWEQHDPLCTRCLTALPGLQAACLLQFPIFQAARGPVTLLLHNPSHSTGSLGELGQVGTQLLCTIVLAGTKPRHWARGRGALVLNAAKEQVIL